MILQFQVPLKAAAKARPRLGEGGRVYTPAKTRTYERQVKQFCHVAMLQARVKMLEEPLAVIIQCYFRPQNQARIDTPCASRPDVDNLAKSLLDGMNGILFRDDAQVCKLIVEKWWGLPERSNIIVSTLFKPERT